MRFFFFFFHTEAAGTDPVGTALCSAAWGISEIGVEESEKNKHGRQKFQTNVKKNRKTETILNKAASLLGNSTNFLN